MSMLSCLDLLEPEFGMTATRPVNQQHDLSGIVIDIGDYFSDKDSCNSLLQSHVCRWGIPNSRQVLRQTHKNLPIGYERRLSLVVELP